MRIDILIDILTDKEGGGGGGGGGGEGGVGGEVDLSLKSNNPTPTGGEQSKIAHFLKLFV